MLQRLVLNKLVGQSATKGVSLDGNLEIEIEIEMATINFPGFSELTGDSLNCVLFKRKVLKIKF